MMSLVAAYSDSNSSDDDTKEDVKPAGEVASPNLNVNPKDGVNADSPDSCERLDKIVDEDDDFIHLNSSSSSRPFSRFEVDNDGDEDEDDDDELEASTEAEDTPAQLKLHLSNPFRQNYGSSDRIIQGDSVFEIPFLDQETKKSAALERHVKMTQVAGTHEMINGKKICWNYRKGKCRFGHNCTFAHDSDIQQAVEKKSSEIKGQTYFNTTDQQSEQSGTDYVEEDVVISSPHLGTRNPTVVKVNSDDLSPTRKSNDGIGKKGKKRHGLVQTLQPGKKIMKSYYQNQSQS